MPPRLQLFPTTPPDAAGNAPDRHAAALVLRVAREMPDAGTFAARRARDAARRLPDGSERRLLLRILDTHLVHGGPPGDRACALLGWAGHLEMHGRLTEAATALEIATGQCPDDAGLALHAARIARKAGDQDRARDLYARVRELDDGRGHLGRMASVGCALVARDPVRELGRAIRRAVIAGDSEAAAVAQEARARLRRRNGDVDGAVRDFVVSGARFDDPVDIGRVGHALADLFTAAGDLPAARRALLETERRGHPEQVRRARGRLFSIARESGDDLGIRRWGEAGPPPLVSIAPRTPRPSGPSRGDRLARGIDRALAVAGD